MPKTYAYTTDVLIPDAPSRGAIAALAVGEDAVVEVVAEPVAEPVAERVSWAVEHAAGAVAPIALLVVLFVVHAWQSLNGGVGCS